MSVAAARPLPGPRFQGARHAFLLDQSQRVRNWFDRAPAFINRFICSVKVEQAKVRQPRCHGDVRWFPGHAAVGNSDLHDVQTRGQNLGQGWHRFRLHIARSNKYAPLALQLVYPITDDVGQSIGDRLRTQVTS